MSDIITILIIALMIPVAIFFMRLASRFTIAFIVAYAIYAAVIYLARIIPN